MSKVGNREELLGICRKADRYLQVNGSSFDVGSLILGEPDVFFIDYRHSIALVKLLVFIVIRLFGLLYRVSVFVLSVVLFFVLGPSSAGLLLLLRVVFVGG